MSASVTEYSHTLRKAQTKTLASDFLSFVGSALCRCLRVLNMLLKHIAMTVTGAIVSAGRKRKDKGRKISEPLPPDNTAVNHAKTPVRNIRKISSSIAFRYQNNNV